MYVYVCVCVYVCASSRSGAVSLRAAGSSAGGELADVVRSWRYDVQSSAQVHADMYPKLPQPSSFLQRELLGHSECVFVCSVVCVYVCV